MSCNTCLLDFDNAPCIGVIGGEDLSFGFAVEYEAPFDLSQGSFRLVFSKDLRGECPVLTIEQGQGLSVDGQTLLVAVPKTHGLEWGQYYGQVRNDIDDDQASIILKVDLLIRSTIAKAS